MWDDDQPLSGTSEFLTPLGVRVRVAPDEVQSFVRLGQRTVALQLNEGGELVVIGFADRIEDWLRPPTTPKRVRLN